LFIDIVGYSKMLIAEQSELLRQLTKVVRETERFRITSSPTLTTRFFSSAQTTRPHGMYQ
jgi:hypothetical protein